VPGTVFVTGGSGLLGKAIVESLVAEGRPVRALVRSDAAAEDLAALGAVPVRGDVLDRASLESGLEGCDVAYHVAGANAFCLPDPTPLFEVNVTGSRNVVHAAAAAGVRRLVYTSSAATLGEEEGKVGNEEAVHRGWFLSNYERSKFEAEQAVLEAARETELAVVCVNPASVQGPGRTGGTARLLLDFLNGKLRSAVDTRLSLVDIADCTRGHLLAEADGRPGERYVLCGSSLTVREGLELLARLTGLEDRPRFLPPQLALALSTGVQAVARVRRRKAPVCRELVRTLLHGHTYDGSKATRELGLSYTPIEDTLRRTVAWYVEQGLIERTLPGVTPSPGEPPAPR
jgi:dihydroflavonol-4-reductase